MGVQHSANFVPNFFGGLKSFGKAGIDELTGDTKQAGIDFQNAGIGLSNSFNFIGKHFGESTSAPVENADEQQQDYLKQQRQNLITATNPNSYYNSQNWKSVSSKTSGAVYGGQSSISGITKPSDLMSISDPTTKVINSAVRGDNSKAWSSAKNQLDISHSASLSSATSGSAMPSDNINSAGGTGMTSSSDQNQGDSTSSASAVSS